MTASGEQLPALTVEYDVGQPVGTVRADARILVRPAERRAAEHQAAAILRLRRYLAHLSLLRYRDLAQDGSPLGPERDAATLPSDDPRAARERHEARMAEYAPLQGTDRNRTRDRHR